MVKTEFSSTREYRSHSAEVTGKVSDISIHGKNMDSGEGHVKQIQAQLFEKQTNYKKLEEDEAAEKLAREYVKAQVQKIESALNRTLTPIPTPNPKTVVLSRNSYLDIPQKESKGSKAKKWVKKSITAAFENITNSLPSLTGAAFPRQPSIHKDLSRQPSLNGLQNDVTVSRQPSLNGGQTLSRQPSFTGAFARMPSLTGSPTPKILEIPEPVIERHISPPKPVLRAESPIPRGQSPGPVQPAQAFTSATTLQEFLEITEDRENNDINRNNERENATVNTEPSSETKEEHDNFELSEQEKGPLRLQLQQPVHRGPYKSRYLRTGMSPISYRPSGSPRSGTSIDEATSVRSMPVTPVSVNKTFLSRMASPIFYAGSRTLAPPRSSSVPKKRAMTPTRPEQVVINNSKEKFISNIDTYSKDKLSLKRMNSSLIRRTESLQT